ncbi:MAG: hypothetical protein K6G60_10220 [Lachnospiraceae bacterium]|nr:hypothetical protein [Lachnospiraceae bacterium]
MALKFVLVKDETGYDISDIVQKVTWSGRKNSPARSLQLTLLDDPTLGENNRAGIDVYEGNHLIFTEDGEELFRGIVMKQSRTQDRTLNITAYDNAIYLSNNKDSFKYKKKTVTAIFLDVCKRFEISRGEVAAVKYKIPALVEVNTTIYDILCAALSQTYKATGERFYILSKKGQLHLIRRKEQLTKLVLETGEEGSQYGNLTQYTYSKDISNTRTRLKLISQKGKVIVQWSDKDLEKKIGMMQDVQVPDDSLKKKKLKTMIVTMANELKKPSESLSVTAIGISQIYSGMAVFISIPEIGIGRTFYVDQDTHTWDGDYHQMKLTLNFAAELESISESGETEINSADDSSATAAAKQAVKDAAAALKLKKAAEKKVIQAGSKAEKAADKADKALASAQKYAANAAKAKSDSAKDKALANASKQAKVAQTEAAKANTEYEASKVALVEVKSLLNVSQSTITTKADFAVQQAESSARRANEAATAAEEYL